MGSKKGSENTKKRAYKLIKEKIINLDLKPGEIVSDRRLAEELKVSRTPVREALHLLEKEGFIKEFPRRGFHVGEISLKNIEELYDVRITLETAALRRSAQRDVAEKKEAIEKMNQLLKRHRVLVRTFKPGGKFFEDAEFHKALMAMSGNKYMLEILESIFERIQMLRSIQGVDEKRVKVALKQHQEIFQYFRAGNYPKAEKMLCNHIEEAKENIMSQIRNRSEILHL